MTTIRSMTAIEILDSRGDPTVEVSLMLSDKSEVKASTPSGASTGASEAFELRDGDKKRFGGRGVLKAVANINTIIQKALIDHDVADQKGIDELMIELDGTENKSKLGSNAILAVSLAVARGAASAYGLPLYEYLRSLTSLTNAQYKLPVPLINVINGGSHADNNLDIQEYWLIPAREEPFKERIRQGSEVYHALGMILTEAGKKTNRGDEGGYAPDLASNEEAFDFLLKAIRTTTLNAGKDVWVGLDAGSSVLFDKNRKVYNLKLDKAELSNSEMIDYYMSLLEKYPIKAIEDPLAEEEWGAWSEITQKIKAYNPDIELIGDDLYTTNIKRFSKGIERSIANSILIKPNQIGTVSETLSCIEHARKNNYSTVISHRSGETSDSFIADLAVGVNSEYIKTGATASAGRTVKYNRLLEIEKTLYG